MFKKYYLIVKKFLKLGANNKVLLFHLFFSAILRSMSILLIPFSAAKIVEYATVGDFRMAFVFAFMFLAYSLIYVLCHHYNYVAYAKNSIFTHNKLQELILNKVTTYDENFSKEISTPYIINTAFNDVGKVMQVPDQAFDGMAGIISIFATLIIMFKVNVFIGVFTIALNLFSFYLLAKNMDKHEYYFSAQNKHQDNISGLMGQVLDGNKEIKSFNISDDIGQ